MLTSRLELDMKYMGANTIKVSQGVRGNCPLYFPLAVLYIVAVLGVFNLNY